MKGTYLLFYLIYIETGALKYNSLNWSTIGASTENLFSQSASHVKWWPPIEETYLANR